MPRMRWRVVCGRGVTMLSFCPTSALSSVDLPTFGRPTSAAKPLRKSGAGALNWVCPEAFRSPRAALGGLLLGAAPARAATLGARPSARHLAADAEGLRVILALDVQHRVARQAKPARLQVLLQARLGVLERLGRWQRRDARREQPRDERRRRPEPAVEIDRPAQRLERIRQDRLAAETAALELPGAELQHRPDTELERHLGERLAAHQAGAQAAQVPFGRRAGRRCTGRAR